MGCDSRPATRPETYYARRAVFVTVRTRAARSAASTTPKICLCRDDTNARRAPPLDPNAQRSVFRFRSADLGGDGRDPARAGARDSLAALHLGGRSRRV